MVDYTEEYRSLMRSSAGIYDEMIQLYAPDKQAENDWADITVAEARTQRNGLLECLADPPNTVIAEDTSSLIASFRHFIDSHWADYREIPVANPEKRVYVEKLHAELEAIISGVGQIHNAVRRP